MRSVQLVALLALGVASGCSRSPSTAPGVATRSVASYKYENRGAGGAYQRGEAGTFSLTTGNNAVSVQEGRLTVNGKGYSALKNGDSIAVDESGGVTVNGALRSAE
jgi:hypothetical protein